ncbi:molybdopterin-binding protein [Bradyrhizobium sp. SYSU BS000235]|uniref:molybdopterin-binding protein n=1 Tax=Bradyrhizobium sp. SYSU BS000235 TaxID=3411332 RepID=UPI003C78E4C3
MNPRPATGSLISLEEALSRLLERCEPAEPKEVPISQALGHVLAQTLTANGPYPAQNTATRDGWALRSQDLVGATAYSPVLLNELPPWVESGDALPAGCDCVLEPEVLEQIGPMVQVIAETIPGAGVRRIGEDLKAESAPVPAGKMLSAVDLVIARAIGLEKLATRRPLVRIVNVPPANGASSTALLIAEAVRRAGADVMSIEAAGRDAKLAAAELNETGCDMILIIGGTGEGRADATVAALAEKSALLAHGIALQPGRTTAIGRAGKCPVVALPGALDQALAAWWTIALPVLDRLSGRHISEETLPLALKISSGPGMADVVLLKREEAKWLPLSIGDLSLGSLSRADAWVVIPGRSEGYASGTLCTAYLLRDTM